MATNSGLGFYDKDFCIVIKSTDLLKENITRILMTRPGERINDLTYGSRLQEYIFSNSSLAIEDILVEIKSSIERCEPRVSVNKVILEKNENETINISVYAIEKSTKKVVDVGVIL